MDIENLVDILNICAFNLDNPKAEVAIKSIEGWYYFIDGYEIDDDGKVVLIVK